MPRRLLPHLVLAEPAGGSDGAIRFRLVGTELVQRIGRDATGKTSADVMQGGYRVYVEGLYPAVIATARPLYAETTRQWPAAVRTEERRVGNERTSSCLSLGRSNKIN